MLSSCVHDNSKSKRIINITSCIPQNTTISKSNHRITPCIV
ncbi:hypothetical protein SLEP1_g23824 [Rubroshorea leprosula]|uniref:Uncharacterized protein n=1 Tax=Rubroshorea leprosula TaxID=152421 RepID=A0AAV5JJU9_9ROSI|nr:hypothetical protein SLEP1_g23824 [Rubroshorea leprosula]